jgi:hypothetical protein
MLRTSISPNLDTHSTQAYTVFMKQLTTLLFIVMFIFAGSVSVPRCYVLQPDCPERGTFACPYAASSKQIVDASNTGGCCRIAENEVQQRQKKSVPSGMMARFKIDQDRHIDDLNIEAPCEWSLQENFYPTFYETDTSRPVFSRRLVHFHPPPLSVLFQKQSFLL